MTRSRILFLLVLMMGLINIRPTKNFFSLIDAYISGKSLAVLEGGTGSSKTISALQFFTRLARDENVPGVFSIVSESMPHLRQGALRDFKTIVLGNQWEEKRFNYSNNIYEWDHSIFEFFSADQEGKVHGPRRDFLYLNEVIHVPKAIYEDMSDRTRKFEIVDFNPRFEFWMHEYKKREDVAWIHSTYKDALEVLPKETIRKIERMEQINPQRWRIYGLGLVGNVEGLVHPMFLADIDELPEGGVRFFGLDFGYTNDPTALVQCVVKGEDLFCDELVYETGLTNQQIGKKFERVGVKKEEDEIFADAAEPKSIEEIYQLGYNIKPAPKGADSVEHGIQLVNNYKQHWTKRSLNAHKEQRNYCYIVDKMNKPTNKPIDDFNHCFVAGTLITTKRGDVPIENIILQDKILTRKGWKDILFCGETGIKNVSKYIFTNGIELTSTSSHPVFTGRGFINISDLTQADTLCILNIKGGLPCLKAYFLKVKNTAGILAALIEPIRYILKIKTNICTEKFTRTDTGLSLKNIMFTTLMKTRSIIQSKISKQRKHLSTCLAMLKIQNGSSPKNQGDILPESDLKQKNGTEALRGDNGTESTLKNQKQDHIYCAVKHAERNLMPRLIIQNSAASTVRLNTSEELTEKQKVYNLSIKECPEYFANNILVHNCMDARRYACMAKLKDDESPDIYFR